MTVYWLWGTLLGLVLTAALPLIAGLLLHFGFVESGDVKIDESMLVAVAMVGFSLMGALIFKPSEADRQIRTVRGRIREDKE